MIITGKNGNTQMKRDVQQLRTAEEKSAALLALSFNDGMILQSAELIEYDSFKDNHAYNTIGEIFKYGDRYFEVVAPHTSNAAAYPVETTFAYYRLVELAASGTIDDPIPYPETTGIVVNVASGLYYSYKGGVYLAKADMPDCVYPPDTPTLWQWEKVEGR